MKSFLDKNQQVIGLLGALIASIITIIYLKLPPEQAATATGAKKAILLYGHSLCWVLLGTASIIWGFTKRRKLAAILAFIALGVYIIFMGAVFFSS